MTRSALLLVATGVFACGAPDAGDGTQGGADAIIGGSPARSTTLDAIGSLRYSSTPRKVDAGPIPSDFKTLCTATLIAPSLIVTAKHCAVAAGSLTTALSDNQTLFFATGADATKPKKTSRVIRTWLSPLADNGYIAYGSDVAVMQLEDTFDDVTPFHVADAHLTNDVKGSRFSIVGFGYRNKNGSYGSRRAGTTTLQATGGAFMASVFDSKEDMLTFVQTEENVALSDDDVARLNTLWGRTLLPQYEAFTGLAYGDAQPCNGDSGAPLLARIGDQLVIGGVVSGSHKLSDRSVDPCSVLGQIYATFGPLVQSTFSAAEQGSNQTIGRTTVAGLASGDPNVLPEETAPSDDGGAPDPCVGLSTAGVCAGATVQRCIAATEGPQRPVRIDCSLVLSSCAVNATTKLAECIDAPAGAQQ